MLIKYLEIVVILLFTFIQPLISLKILVYNPRFGRSHVKFIGNLADILVQNGHEVISYQPINSRKFNETGVKLAKNLIREADYPLTINQNFFSQQLWTAKMQGIWRSYMSTQMLSQSFSMYCRPVYISPLTQTVASIYGIPSTTSFVPEITTPAIPPFTTWERFKNFAGHLISYNFIYPQMFKNYNSELRPILGDEFDIKKKLADVSLIFINSDEFMEFPRPTSHKFINIGGIGMSNTGKLNEKYQNIMEKAKGIVYVSFGTVAKSSEMPESMKRAFLDALAQFPDILFLWKYEDLDDKIFSNYSNVHIDNWFPQAEILFHQRTLGFISHGGAGSISEAIFSGLPIIVVPLFADQIRNSKMVEFRNVGISLSKFEISQQNIVDALNRILNDKRYKQNALKLSQLIKAKPMDAQRRFVEYVQLAANYDINSNLKIPQLNTIEYYNLDIIFIFSIITILSLTLVYKIIKLIILQLLNRIRKIKND